MKGKSLIAGIVVVVLALISGVVWYDGNEQNLSAPSYGFIHLDGDELVVNFGNTLVWLDEGGREKKTLDLDSLNIHLSGDYGFLRANDGVSDLLVYHRDHEPDPLFNLKRYLRIKETVDLTPRGREGFYRCDIATKQCRPFGQKIPRLDSTFRLAIDDRDNTLYLAHTPAFVLYKIDGAGHVLAQSDNRTFIFPNQIELVGGELWVADTNRHRIARISTATESFAKVVGEFPATLGSKHRFPHDFALDLPNEKLWVLVGDPTMGNGRIASYDSSGKLLGELSGDIGPDPLGVRYWKDTLWLADYAEPRFRRFSVSDNNLKETTDIQSPTLQHLADRARQQQLDGEQLSSYGVYGLILVMIGGFIAAWKLEKKQTLSAFSTQHNVKLNTLVSATPEPTPGNEIFWITNKLTKHIKWRIGGVFAIGVLGLLSFLPLLLTQKSYPIKFWLVISFVEATMLLLMLSTSWLLYRVSKQKLGVIGHSIIMERDGHSHVCLARDIHYSDSHLITDNLVIFLGNGRRRIFDAKQLEQFVFPRLKEATHLKTKALYVRLWQLREPQLIYMVVLIGLPLIALIAIQLLKLQS